MSGKKIRIEQSFKLVKVQSNKTNDVHEDGIEKIPQSQEKFASSKPYYPGKPWLDYDVTNKSVTCYFCKHQHSLDNLKVERLKENTFLDKGSDHWKKALPKLDKHTRSHCC